MITSITKKRATQGNLVARFWFWIKELYTPTQDLCFRFKKT